MTAAHRSDQLSASAVSRAQPSRRDAADVGRKGAEALLTAVLLGGWGLGLGFVLAAFAVWMMPEVLPVDAMLVAKVCAALVLSGLLVWFANRGTRTELHFDTGLNELREVLRRPGSRAEAVARWRFDEFEAVEIRGARVAASQAPSAELVLRFRNSDRVLQVAVAPRETLAPIAARIKIDMALPSRRATLRRPTPGRARSMMPRDHGQVAMPLGA